MANMIWDKFSEESRAEYVEFLKLFGALSGLFKDNIEGANARKPYLYYRNHEQLFARVFDVEDLTRRDSAFDAVGIWEDERVGIGLKTWIHSRDFTFQKVAEFNRLAPEVIYPLIENGTADDVIRKVSELRNKRIMLDKGLYKTDRDVYHFVTRDDNTMKIIETPYELIDIESLELISSNGKTFTFKDKSRRFKFYKSKSVLLEEFDASEAEVIAQIPIEQFDDPFELIRMIKLPQISDQVVYEEIYLPLYQDKKDEQLVSDKSGVNIRHAKSKNKGSNTPRPAHEIEIRISTWIHRVFPGFFGIDAFDKDQVKNAELNDFDLILPDGTALRGRIKQDNGKSLQTSPQSALGKWVLEDVLKLHDRDDKVTWELLDELGIDSLKITKIDDKHFKITVAETNAYEQFKLDYEEKMREMGLSGSQLPYFKPELF